RKSGIAADELLYSLQGAVRGMQIDVVAFVTPIPERDRKRELGVRDVKDRRGDDNIDFLQWPLLRHRPARAAKCRDRRQDSESCRHCNARPQTLRDLHDALQLSKPFGAGQRASRRSTSAPMIHFFIVENRHRGYVIRNLHMLSKKGNGWSP